MKLMLEEKCSFCGKSASEVYRLFTENNMYICNECVQRCNDLLFQEKLKDAVKEEFKKHITRSK